MRRVVVLAGMAMALVLAGCATTGNPRQGGLFGWSEAKARQRQVERRDQIAAAEARIEGEQRRSGHLRSRNDAASREMAATAAQTRGTNAKLHTKETELLAKVAQLETESPTAATASRARRLRMQVEQVLADRVLTPVARARQLRDLEAEIDAAFANVSR